MNQPIFHTELYALNSLITGVLSDLESYDYDHFYIKHVVYSIDYQVYISSNDFLSKLVYLRAESDPYITNPTNCGFNPRLDWNIFTAFKYSDPIRYRSSRRPQFTESQKISELHREILADYVGTFENVYRTVSFITSNDPETSNFIRNIKDTLTECIDKYKSFNREYRYYLHSMRTFTLLRIKSIVYVASKYPTPPKFIESSVTLASNPLRRALEYVC